MDQADVRGIFGDQGMGKTNSAVAIVVEDAYANLTGIINLTNGERFDAKPLSDKDIDLLTKRHIVYNPLKHIRVFSADGDSKIVTKPNGWAIDSSLRIFANFHFYGIPFSYVGVEEIVANINTDLMTNGWIVLDESILTEKRDTMTGVGKMMAWFGAQARRRYLKMIIIAQYANMVQSRFNQFATTRVSCTYDKKTHMITLDVNRNSEVMRSTTYYAPDYWKFYRHDEIVAVPQYKIDKTMANMYSP